MSQAPPAAAQPGRPHSSQGGGVSLAEASSLVVDVNSHVPAFQNHALSVLAHASAQPGFQLHMWPGLALALLRVVAAGVRGIQHIPEPAPYGISPTLSQLLRHRQQLSAARQSAAILRASLQEGGSDAAAAAVEAGCLPLFHAVLRLLCHRRSWTAHQANEQTLPPMDLATDETSDSAGTSTLTHLASSVLRSLPPLAMHIIAERLDIIHACGPLLEPGPTSEGCFLAVFAAETVAALLLAVQPGTPAAGRILTMLWSQSGLLDSLLHLVTLPYEPIRALAKRSLNAELDPGLLAGLAEPSGYGQSTAEDGGKALIAQRAASIATTPDYMAMVHQAQAISAGIKVLRRLVEVGREVATPRLANSYRLVEAVLSVVLTQRPGYPLEWQAAVQDSPACRVVLDSVMTPVMVQRSLAVRQARFDAGVLLAMLGADPATRPVVACHADRLALGIASGRVSITQPLIALLNLFTVAPEPPGPAQQQQLSLQQHSPHATVDLHQG